MDQAKDMKRHKIRPSLFTRTFRKFHFIFGIALVFLFTLCTPGEPKITTVTGKIPVSEMGKTLHHEHLLVDFIGADSTGYHRWNRDEVVEKVLPYLSEIKALGYETLVECT